MSQALIKPETRERSVPVPDGPTPRHKKLKLNYLRQKPSITIHRAKIITELDREQPGLPRILLRAKAQVAHKT